MNKTINIPLKQEIQTAHWHMHEPSTESKYLRIQDKCLKFLKTEKWTKLFVFHKRKVKREDKCKKNN